MRHFDFSSHVSAPDRSNARAPNLCGPMFNLVSRVNYFRYSKCLSNLGAEPLIVNIEHFVKCYYGCAYSMDSSNARVLVVLANTLNESTILATVGFHNFITLADDKRQKFEKEQPKRPSPDAHCGGPALLDSLAAKLRRIPAVDHAAKTLFITSCCCC